MLAYLIVTDPGFVSVEHFELLHKECDNLIASEVVQMLVMSRLAPLVECYAQEKRHQLRRYKTHQNLFGDDAATQRIKSMLRDADIVVCFGNEKPGSITAEVVRQALKSRKPTYFIKFTPV